MKKSNIAFSGFMAAILVSVGAANAATTQIASRQYVDNKVGTIQESVTEVKNQYTTINETVTNLGDTINNEESGLTQQIENITQQIGDSTAGLVKDINDAKTTAESAKQTAESAQSAADALGVTVGNAEAGLVKDVNDLETSVGGLQTTVGQLDTEMDSKLDSATAATTYEVLSNKTQDLATDAGSTDKYPSAKAVVDWVSNTVTDGIEINTDKIQNGAITTEKLGNDAVTSDKIADDAVGSEHIQTGAVGSAEIADGAVGNADLAADSVTTDKIKDGTISTADLDAALNAEIDGKEDKINKATTIDSTNQASTDAYPSVKAVYDWTTTQIANVEFDPSELAPGSIDGDAIQDGSISGDKITDGTITSDQIADGTVGTGDIADGAITGDKLDETLAGQIADIDGKQDIAMGVGHENHIVTTDASGNITSAATIGQDKVTGLTTALEGKASIDDIPTTVAELTDASNYATTGALTSGLAGKEDTSNKTKIINDGNKSSETLFPTIGAITTWTDQQIQKLSTDGIPVNPDNIGSNAITTDKIANGAVTTPKIADNAVTEDKLSDELNAEIDGKANAADVYTKLETDGKIVELALPRPKPECQAESGLCVLSVTTDGDLAWVNVTAPAE